jgi:thiaminase (transcriptional activator TenA)
VSVAAQLWRDNADLARAALAHRFVRAITDGTLDRASYAAYIGQDALFLEVFARAYALALARSPDAHGVEAFADLIAGVRDELRLHRAVARRWGIDLAALRPAPATRAYTDFLLTTAARADPGLICAAMTPCMRLYAFLGRQLSRGPVAEAYREWVTTYADPGFETLAQRMEGLLDRYATEPGPVAEVYRQAMRLELDFFDAAAPGSARGRGEQVGDEPPP